MLLSVLSPCQGPLILPFFPALLQRHKNLLHGFDCLHCIPVVRMDPLHLLSSLVFIGDCSIFHTAGGRNGLQCSPVLQNEETGLGELLGPGYVLPADVRGRRQPEPLAAVDGFSWGLCSEGAVGREAVEEVQERWSRAPFQILKSRFPGLIFRCKNRRSLCSPCWKTDSQQQETVETKYSRARCPPQHLWTKWTKKNKHTHTHTKSGLVLEINKKSSKHKSHCQSLSHNVENEKQRRTLACIEVRYIQKMSVTWMNLNIYLYLVQFYSETFYPSHYTTLLKNIVQDYICKVVFSLTSQMVFTCFTSMINFRCLSCF